MFQATGADIHSVAGLVHEYGMVARLAAAHGRHADPAFPHWARSKSQIEHCLRLYIHGNSIALAKRASGYFSRES